MRMANNVRIEIVGLYPFRRVLAEVEKRVPDVTWTYRECSGAVFDVTFKTYNASFWFLKQEITEAYENERSRQRRAKKAREEKAERDDDNNDEFWGWVAGPRPPYDPTTTTEAKAAARRIELLESALKLAASRFEQLRSYVEPSMRSDVALWARLARNGAKR